MLTKQEVKHIAKLARLGITEKEEEKFSKELSSILDYIEKLKEVDISGVEPTSHPHFSENVMRADETDSSKRKVQPASPRQGGSAKLLELAPDKKGDYIKVKSVF